MKLYERIITWIAIVVTCANIRVVQARDITPSTAPPSSSHTLPPSSLSSSDSRYTNNSAFADGSIEEAAVQLHVDLCTIEKIDANEFTQERFFREYYQKKPFILINYRVNSPRFRQLTDIDELLATYGDEVILAASANTYSHTKMPMPFREYVELIRNRPLTIANESDSTAYFFGDHDDPLQFTSDSDILLAIRHDQQLQRRLSECHKVHSDGDSIASCEDEVRKSNPGPTFKRRPIWAKLLRQYHPPTYAIPNKDSNKSQMFQSNPTLVEDVADTDTHDGTVRRVKLLASNQAEHKYSFTSADEDVDVDDVLSSSSPFPSLPPRFDFARYSFGLGSHRSGVPFHFHGAAIGEVLHGRKRWFLYPPKQLSTPSDNEVRDENPLQYDQSSPSPSASSSLPFTHFHPHLTQLQWMTNIYTQLKPHELPLQCTLHPEELIYVPANYYHATMNLGELAIFISTFLDEIRMEAVIKQHTTDTLNQ